MANKKTTEETDEERKARETVETIADSIVTLANGVKSVLEGKLNKRAILVLLASATRMNQQDIEKVLDAAASLDKTFLKK